MKHKFEVHTQTKGILKFDEIPKDAYIAEGYQNPNDKNRVYWFGNDNGTCLIPFKTLEGEAVYKPIKSTTKK